jgi:putative Holliday junction resolvase
MNILGIDYGTKRIGLAISINGVISPILPIKNDCDKYNNILKVIKAESIDKIFVGICEGDFAKKTQKFVSRLQGMVNLEVETVEEAVSTIEADEIYKLNKKSKKKYKSLIDSIAAAVILRRIIN